MTDESAMRKQALRARRWNILIFCVFAALFAALLAAALVYRYQHTYSRFKWDTDKEHRYKIVNDLLDQTQLTGMTEDDVLQLLGSEDSTQTSFKISKEDFPPESTLVYYLGVDFMDNSWLVISLDNGIVTGCRIDFS